MDRVTRLNRSSRASTIDGDGAAAWSVIAGTGPGRHWYLDAAPFVLRGALDRMLGGQGRRWPVPDHSGDPAHRGLRAGDRAGFWRVSGSAAQTLTLVADVRAPGRVDLLTRVHAVGNGRIRVEQSVGFEPHGLLGQLYLFADVPAREALIELVHRDLLAEIRH